MRQVGGYKSFQFVQQRFWRWLLSALQQASRILGSGRGHSIVKDGRNTNCFWEAIKEGEDQFIRQIRTFRRYCFVTPVSSRVHFVGSHFITGTLCRLLFHHGDTLSPAISSRGHFVAGAQRRLWNSRELELNMTNSVQTVPLYILVFTFTIFLHLYLYIHTLIVIRFNFYMLC